MAKKRAWDRTLFSVVALLVAFGLTMVYSASAVQDRDPVHGMNRFLIRQALAAALGLVALWVAMHVDYRKLRRRWVVYGGIGFVVTLLVTALLGPALNDTNRWLFLSGVSVQPSELAKLAVVLFVAYQIHRQHERDGDSTLLVPCGFVLALVVGLILLQPDLGTAALICGTAVLMLFVSGVRWRFFISGAMVLVPALAALILTVDYRRERLLAFLNPGVELQGINWQAHQSQIAVGSGGWSGLGLGNGLQKLYYLPHPHSDSVYSVVAEELGFLGAVLVLALFGVILWRGVVAGQRVTDPFGRHLAWGLTALIVLQAAIHVGVNLTLLPTKGIPLPFISFGGSSLVVAMAAAGILINISEHG